MHLKDINDQLGTINKKIDEDDMVNIILRVSPSSHEAFIEYLYLLIET